jgi:RHS repeat-associated protein
VPIVPPNQTRKFTYDAENRQATATISTGTTTTTASYTYDGLGQRVTKTTGGQTTTYVYDAFGNLAAEYGSGTSPCGTNTCYLTWDPLGSTRPLTDATGSNSLVRYDYLPFGGELLGSNGRAPSMGYSSSPDFMNPKFTGKNRDSETVLDWFEVRYMSGAQGRFQSPDPGNAGAGLGDSQTWNAYAYVDVVPPSWTVKGHRIGMSGIEPADCSRTNTGQDDSVLVGCLENLVHS